MIEFQFWKAASITLKVSAKSQEMYQKPRKFFSPN